ncbi:hypothetical protein P8625_06890 [Tenacibaculum tangerinum]|uniref:Bacteriocin n=1 Tax=Tenacibaculum tangerinum TaxID=3038772 RepID=A0ABY8L8D7_9FLAO|nr:hypothetical protein [Tenacibaculum tangerinum]WGH76862.1 hypothetical protein P8625_06890 [Tenacibaculum tangerinum]
MKKSISKLGNTLNKIEQQQINGGYFIPVGDSDGECDQESQSKIRCYHGSNRNCDMDAICNNQGYCECAV